jgi:DNA-binding SARP family transcriptional activator
MVTIQSTDGAAHFYVMGDVHIESVGLDRTMTLPRATQNLLGFLLIHRDRFHSREVVADRLWGEQDGERARLRVNTAIWRLREVFGSSRHQHQDCLIQSAGGTIRFNTAIPYWLDVEMLEMKLKNLFEKRLDQLTRAEVTEAEGALELYRGDLLEPNNSPWVLVERERMRALYIDALAILAEYRMRENDFVLALALGHKALRLEPLREDVHRIVMESYARNGRAAEALRHFEICRKLLYSELAIAPAKETALLRERIFCEVAIPAATSMAAPPRAGKTGVLAIRRVTERHN